VYHHDDEFEERLTLWEAGGLNEALDKGEADAMRYAASVGSKAIFVQVCPLVDGFAPKDGAEVFSLVRRSDLSSPDYLDRFVDTGTEFSRDDLEGEVLGELLRERLAQGNTAAQRPPRSARSRRATEH
jgi:hypothetical protein